MLYNGELVPLMRIIGIFPPKSRILKILSLFDMMSKFPGGIPVGGDTWTSFWRKERRRIRIKKYRVQGSCFRSNISETVKDIRVPFSLLAKCKSHATKRYKRRCCSCYRFSDIIVVNIKKFSILLEQTRICRRTSSHGIIKGGEDIGKTSLNFKGVCRVQPQTRFCPKLRYRYYRYILPLRYSSNRPTVGARFTFIAPPCEWKCMMFILALHAADKMAMWWQEKRYDSRMERWNHWYIILKSIGWC